MFVSTSKCTDTGCTDTGPTTDIHTYKMTFSSFSRICILTEKQLQRLCKITENNSSDRLASQERIELRWYDIHVYNCRHVAVSRVDVVMSGLPCCLASLLVEINWLGYSSLENRILRIILDSMNHHELWCLTDIQSSLRVHYHSENHQITRSPFYLSKARKLSSVLVENIRSAEIHHNSARTLDIHAEWVLLQIFLITKWRDIVDAVDYSLLIRSSPPNTELLFRNPTWWMLSQQLS